MFVVIKRNRCRKEGWEGVDWGEAKTLQGSGVKDGKSLLWMKRTMRELEGKAETHSPPGDKTAEGVRKVEDNAKADAVQTCPLQARSLPPALGEHSNLDFTGGEMPPARLCTLFEQGHPAGNGCPRRPACSISTLLRGNTWPSERPTDNNELLCF